MSNNWEQKLEKKVKAHLEGYTACHDFFHAERTKTYSLEIAKHMSVDEDTIIAGALLHDVGYKGNEQSDEGHHLHGIKLAEKWLKEVDFPQEKIFAVLEVVRLHDNFSFMSDYEPTEIVEVKIVQDADRIDSIGAIGVIRNSYYYGERGLPIYDPGPVKKITTGHGPHHSVLERLHQEVDTKWQTLNFPISRKISKRKYLVLKNFYLELKKELEEAHSK